MVLEKSKLKKGAQTERHLDGRQEQTTKKAHLNFRFSCAKDIRLLLETSFLKALNNILNLTTRVKRLLLLCTRIV